MSVFLSFSCFCEGTVFPPSALRLMPCALCLAPRAFRLPPSASAIAGALGTAAARGGPWITSCMDGGTPVPPANFRVPTRIYSYRYKGSNVHECVFFEFLVFLRGNRFSTLRDPTRIYSYRYRARTFTNVCFSSFSCFCEGIIFPLRESLHEYIHIDIYIFEVCPIH